MLTRLTSSTIKALVVYPFIITIRKWIAQPENQLILLLLLAAFPLYYEISRNPVQLWDESRLAVNAAEMARDGNWLVPHFEGTPDHWNTKPPLLIWLEALSFKAFGVSTWALRLPTLLATFGTIILLFRFASRVLFQPLAGFFAVCVLVTCSGYVRIHVARTGDYDALLVFWQLLIWVCFFQYLETGKQRHLTWLTFSFIAAVLTKGPAGLLGLPGLIFYAIGRAKIAWLLRQPRIYLAAATWIIVIGSYFFFREHLDPGYWKAVQANDLGGRFLTVIEGHQHSWDYYLTNLQHQLFSPWLWALAPALLLILLQPAGVVKRAAGLLTAFILGWLLVISSAKSKLEWYDAPIYPALALLIGIGLSILYNDLLSIYLPRLSEKTQYIVRVALVVAIVYWPYNAITRQIIDERKSDFGVGPDAYLGRYVTKLMHDEPQINKLILLSQGEYNAVLSYYKLEFEQKPDRSLRFIKVDEARTLIPGSIVVSCSPAYRAKLDSTFKVIEMHQNASCQTLLLLPR